MIKIGITGQAGFIGTHLFNFLGLLKNVKRIPFKDEYFKSEKKLRDFVTNCDVIVHLAGMNRHKDPQVIYETNIKLVDLLINALEKEHQNPHIIFTSSIQEDLNNPYGESKRIGRDKLANWAENNNAIFTGFILPNVFGPFGEPYYNSAIATFSYQLTHDESPQLQVDRDMKLIYVGELMNEIWQAISEKTNIQEYRLTHTAESKVSELLKKLTYFKKVYFDNGIFPEINSNFDLNLFNTFRCYIDLQKHFPYKLQLHGDDRGLFAETVKTYTGGQFSFSTTSPGITRGNHFHTRKIERFIVIRGKARIQLRRIGTYDVINFDLDGQQPSFIDIPIWYTHNLISIGDNELVTLFWINEFFTSSNSDTYYESVEI
jgi:UDP-2-acetamido-2,6-beta-L-arabino-hexul-4-ose reductase